MHMQLLLKTTISYFADNHIPNCNARVSQNLYRRLPARMQGYSWRLVFSTGLHGFSLATLYRKMAELQDTAVAIAIQDTQQTVGGAIVAIRSWCEK